MTERVDIRALIAEQDELDPNRVGPFNPVTVDPFAGIPGAYGYDWEV